MKTHTAFAALAGALLLFVCCSEHNTLSVTEYSAERTEALAQGRRDSITMRVDVEYPRPEATGKSMRLVGQQVTETLFGEQYAGQDVETAAQSYFADLLTDYRETNLPILERISEDKDVLQMNLSWEDFVSGKFTGNYKSMTTYVVSQYTYTGGAHGMHWDTARVFDLRSGKTVSEEDLFSEGFEAELSSLLWKHAAEGIDTADGIDPEAPMFFVNEIEPNGNFEVSEEGVTYIYNPYEIAPYSAGTIRITVPWPELKTILK